MFYVAGHRMCKTRLKMMVSCVLLTRTTQLHPTGHHHADDVHDDYDYDGENDDNDEDHEAGSLAPLNSIAQVIQVMMISMMMIAQVIMMFQP